jgi:hypothetical protein
MEIPIPSSKEPDIFDFGFDKNLQRVSSEVTDGTDNPTIYDVNAKINSSQVVGGNIPGYMNINNDGTFLGINAGKNTIPPKDNYGKDNVFIGESAGFSNTEGKYNTFLGVDSGYSNINGKENVFIGLDSGFYNNGGMNNVFIGETSGYHHTNGYQNVFLGGGSGHFNDGINNVFIGDHSGYFETASNKLYISNSSATSGVSLIYGDFSSAVVKINGQAIIRDTLTISQTPTAGTFVADSYININLNGTVYKIPCAT